MIPIISIVGKSKAGKTTLIERLVSELKSRGYKVATIKHTTHIATIDTPGKDTWRHIQAGSEATVISSPEGIILFKPTKQESSIVQLMQLFDEEYDIVIAEGFKQGNTPKIEVHRKQFGASLNKLENLIAIASDEPLETSIRQFRLNDIVKLADTIETEIIRPQTMRISTYIDKRLIQLGAHQREIIMNTVLAIAAGINSKDKFESVDISIKRTIDRDHH